MLSRRNYGNQEKVDAQNPFERFFMILVEDLLSTFDIVKSQISFQQHIIFPHIMSA